MSLSDHLRQYKTERSCVQAIFRLQHPLPARCPSCGRAGSYHMRRRRLTYVCSCGGHEIHPKAGTVFRNSKVPLRHWFLVMHLMAESATGMAATEIRRHIGCSPHTAWRMGMAIRRLMREEVSQSGIVEADETFVGGRNYGGRAGRGTNKSVVVGTVARGGKVSFTHVPSAKGSDITGHFSGVAAGSTLVTDEWKAYRGVARRHGLTHRNVHHRTYVWAARMEGDAYVTHTNSIEGQWKHLKRGLKGTYSRVSPRHLQTYLYERMFAYNNRDADRFNILLRRACGL